jgi:hypothetical protein
MASFHAYVLRAQYKHFLDKNKNIFYLSAVIIDTCTIQEQIKAFAK